MLAKPYLFLIIILTCLLGIFIAVHIKIGLPFWSAEIILIFGIGILIWGWVKESKSRREK